MPKQKYTVSHLAELSGVSVRTLHLYDEVGLLKPSSRTEAGYRLYGEAECLRLQQILLYRQLDFPLADIKKILDDPNFDLIRALESQKIAFQARLAQVSSLLGTIDTTIHHLKEQGIMSNLEFLYQGIPKETTESWQKEAEAKWGEEAKHASERLSKLTKPQIEALKTNQAAITASLYALRHKEASNPQVQEQIAQHYSAIRAFWGTAGTKDLQAEAYAGLGRLYVTDERYLVQDDAPQPEFAAFMRDAMAHFAHTRLS